MMKRAIFFFICFTVFFCFSISNIYAQSEADSLYIPPADSTKKIEIGNITVNGNKKTKGYIILREIHFKTGDSILSGKFNADLLRAQYQVYNTTLFTDVAVRPSTIRGSTVDISVTVKEKWYIYPTPQFQLVDRNFNEWLKVYNADFNRVIYGVKFLHYNLTGRRDQLRVFLLNGYARHFAVSYLAPYSNRALNEGFGVSAAFTQNREIPYKTTYYNKLLQFKNGGFVRTTFAAGATYLSRKRFFQTHAISINYIHNSLDDSILAPKYNPGYFNKPKSTVGYPELTYVFQYANTNNIKFPLKGIIWGIGATKRGLAFKSGINMFVFDGLYSKYLSHGKQWYSNIQLHTKLKLPFTQPYINQRALGYGDLYLRGLEYYVIDGVAASIAKYTLRKKIISFNIPVPFKIKAIPVIPFTIYGKTYADGGYVYNRKEFDTRLNNRFLYTGGAGIDILSLYDMNLGIEYSVNQLGERGIFFHIRGGF
jgi:outer membrane protein assembly factor BamA